MLWLNWFLRGFLAFSVLGVVNLMVVVLVVAAAVAVDYEKTKLKYNINKKKFYVGIFKGFVRTRFEHSGPEKLKNSSPKNLVKSNISISIFFAISKMAKYQCLN